MFAGFAVQVVFFIPVPSGSNLNLSTSPQISTHWPILFSHFGIYWHSQSRDINQVEGETRPDTSRVIIITCHFTVCHYRYMFNNNNNNNNDSSQEITLLGPGDNSEQHTWPPRSLPIKSTIIVPLLLVCALITTRNDGREWETIGMRNIIINTTTLVEYETSAAYPHQKFPNHSGSGGFVFIRSTYSIQWWTLDGGDWERP